jgi:hypothetical protein
MASTATPATMWTKQFRFTGFLPYQIKMNGPSLLPTLRFQAAIARINEVIQVTLPGSATTSVIPHNVLGAFRQQFM